MIVHCFAFLEDSAEELDRFSNQVDGLFLFCMTNCTIFHGGCFWWWLFCMVVVLHGGFFLTCFIILNAHFPTFNTFCTGSSDWLWEATYYPFLFFFRILQKTSTIIVLYTARKGVLFSIFYRLLPMQKPYRRTRSSPQDLTCKSWIDIIKVSGYDLVLFTFPLLSTGFCRRTRPFQQSSGWNRCPLRIIPVEWPKWLYIVLL